MWPMARMEIVTARKRRRRWSEGDKLEILQEAAASGLSVAEVARRHDVVPQQIYIWRRQLLAKVTHLSEKLMQLTRAEGGGLLGESPQDLAPVLAHLVDEFLRKPENTARLRLEVPENASLWSRLNPDAFAVLMRNLIENALLHGDAGEAVVVTANGAASRAAAVQSRGRGAPSCGASAPTPLSRQAAMSDAALSIPTLRATSTSALGAA
jgi:transposase-like protein